MRELIGKDEVMAAFEAALAEAGTHAELSRRAGICDEAVSMVARGQRPVTGKLLRHLGFERVPAFRRLPEAEERT